jgi:general secretion pathway protein I
MTSTFKFNNRTSGFTLIEVLLALAIIAIALTALLKATAQNIENTHRIKEKTISHWVAMQGVSMIQLNLLTLNQSQESTQATTMLNQQWYWRAKISSTPLKKMQKITISVSSKQTGPFREELIAFRYLP